MFIEKVLFGYQKDPSNCYIQWLEINELQRETGDTHHQYIQVKLVFH